MPKTTPAENKALVIEAFDRLFNKRDYAGAEHFWSNRYIQHSKHIPAGRDGLFNLIRTLPDSLSEDGKLAEHWDGASTSPPGGAPPGPGVPAKPVAQPPNTSSRNRTVTQ